MIRAMFCPLAQSQRAIRQEDDKRGVALVRAVEMSWASRSTTLDSMTWLSWAVCGEMFSYRGIADPIFADENHYDDVMMFSSEAFLLVGCVGGASVVSRPVRLDSRSRSWGNETLGT